MQVATTFAGNRFMWRVQRKTPSLRSTGLLDRFISVALLALVVLAAIPYGTVDPAWVALFECAIFALTALWIIGSVLSGERHFNDFSLLAPWLALLSFAGMQTLPLWSAPGGAFLVNTRWAVSADPYETSLWILQAAALVLAGLLLSREMRDESRLRRLVVLVIAVGVASALFGLLRHVLQPRLSSSAGLLLPAGLGYGQFVNRNHFALLMEMSFGLTMGLIAGGGVRRIWLPLHIGLAALLWTALVLSNSRGGIMSMVGQLLVLGLLVQVTASRARGRVPGKSRTERLRLFGGGLAARLLLMSCLTLTTIAGVTWVGGDALMNRLEVAPRELSLQSAKRANVRRIAIWKATLSMISEHPLAGVGFGAFWTSFPKYHDGSGRWTPQQAHNDYLELAASGGIVAVALVAWFVIVFIKRARRNLANSSAGSFRRAAAIGALTGLSGVAFHSLVDFGLHVTINALICVALIVIAAGWQPTPARANGSLKT